MCLHTATRRIDKPSAQAQSAWKCFEITDRGGLRFPFCAPSRDDRVRRGRWLSARGGIIGNAPRPQYRAGFHVFTNREDALSYYNGAGTIVLRVRVRRVRTIGMQMARRVLVADQLFVPAKRRR